MRLSLFAFPFVLGCSHAAAPPTTPSTPSPVATSSEMATTPDVDPDVDPTLPSWAPKSCLRYHTAVVRFVSCNLGDAAKREAARESYDATNKRWHEMHDLPAGAIDDVQKACNQDEAAIRARTDPTCPQTTTTPPPST